MTEALQLRGQRGLYRALAPAIPGGRVLELDGGVTAAIVDTAPDFSIFNAVVYDDGAELRDVIDDLADAYADAGVRAWTVWVRPGDEQTAAALRDGGHVLDGEPGLMAATLADMDLEPRTELDLVRDADWRTIGDLNGSAWGAGHHFADVLEPADPAFGSRYVARVDGEPAACAITWTEDANAEVILVATAPEAQVRGLCSELMRTALREARDGGATTTTLEASRKGEPIYERLGYETLGRLALYERRVGR